MMIKKRGKTVGIIKFFINQSAPTNTSHIPVKYDMNRSDFLFIFIKSRLLINRKHRNV